MPVELRRDLRKDIRRLVADPVVAQLEHLGSESIALSLGRHVSEHGRVKDNHELRRVGLPEPSGKDPG